MDGRADKHALVVRAPQTRQVTRVACEALLPDEERPQLLIAGVDGLECSFDVEVSEAMWDQLERERALAQYLMQERKAVHCPEWLCAQISPTGARGGYRFLLETPYFAVKLLRGVPNRPPIYVELRAFGLHTHQDGAAGACAAACAYIREVLLADMDPAWAKQAVSLDTARCSRLDLYLDWQGGWHPAFETEDERCFIKRVHAGMDRFSCDGAVTGYAVGKGDVRARLYNKSVQTKKEQIEWYGELLNQRAVEGLSLGYDPMLEVWRLEFQLRRVGVKGFRVRAEPDAGDSDEMLDAELEAEDLPHVHNVRKALYWAPSFWLYLTRRWLRLVEPTGDPNRGRWPEHPTWAALREGFCTLAAPSLGLTAVDDGPSGALSADGLALVRAKRYTGYRRLLDRMALGVLTTVEAMDTDPGAAVVSYLRYMHRLAGRVRRQQKLRSKQWRREQAERQRKGQTAAVERDLRRGQGARLDTSTRAAKAEQLLDMALGVFTSAGVVPLALAREEDVAQVRDLIAYSLEELETLAAAKGGVRQLLDEKWRKVYKAASPRGMFTVPHGTSV